MVLIPILGEAFLQLVSGELSVEKSGVEFTTLAAGFLAAFVSGLLACKAMIALVKRTRLMGFVFYCAAAGILSIIFYYV
jgi:undecaprenyl-diphosphatase